MSTKLQRLMIIMFFSALSTLAAADQPVFRTFDLLRALRSDQLGIPSLGHAASRAAQASKNLLVTPQAHKAYEFGETVIQDVSFDKVLTTPLAKKLPDDHRVMALSGAFNGQKYVIDYHKATADSLPTPTFLAFATDLRIREDVRPIPDEERGFGVAFSGKLQAGDLSHHTVQNALSGALRVVASTNVRRLKDPQPAATAQASLDRRVLADAHATLPATMDFLERYLRIIPNLQTVDAGAPPQAYTRALSTAALRMDAFTEDYPELAAYLTKLMDRFELSARVRFELANGLRLWELQVQSVERAIAIRSFTTNGLLVPFNQSGQPVYAAAIDPATVRQIQGRLVVDAQGEVLGLSFKAPAITVAQSYQDGPVARIHSRLASMPTPTITGRALGIFPTWAIDLTIPGSISGYAETFTKGLIAGSRGAGSTMDVAIDTRDPAVTLVSAHGGTEFVDNFFINVGMRIVQHYLWPSKEVLDDGRRLTGDALALLAEDLKHLQAANSLAH